jgi:hypothetical protein
MSQVQRVPIAFTPGAGFFVPLTGGAANSIPIRPPAIVGAIELQTLGVSSDSFSINVPEIAAGAFADVPYAYNPSSFPIAFSLVGGASGWVFGDIVVPTLPAACGIMGISRSLVFSLGPPQQPGSPIWTLTARQQYQSASIQGSIRLFSPAGCDAQTLTVVGWIFMLCKPPIVTA